jgi:hypothetical protein
MTTLYVPNEAEANWLDRARFGLIDLGNVHARLFTAPTTIDDNTVIGDFVAATYSGAATVDLDPTTWTVVQGGDGRAYMLTETIEFPVSGASPQTVYGVVYTDDDGNLLGAILFAVPFVVNTTDRPDPYQQKFTLRQEPMI